MEALLQLKESLLRLLFPSSCLHCESELEKVSDVLCSCCSEQLTLADVEKRCLKCFSKKNISAENLCSLCLREGSPFEGAVSAFDYIGPAATLVKHLKYHGKAHLAVGGGSFMTAQWHQMSWPSPDLVIPVPLALPHQINRGFNQSLLLAQQVGKLNQWPVLEILGRKSGDYSQAGLNRFQRQQMSLESFYIRIKRDLEGKTLLLVDDVMTTGTTLRRCAELLQDQGASRIYTLTLCRAIM